MNRGRNGGKWTETVLYNFGKDALDPSGHLVVDSRGNLYGTTGGGGSSDFGTVYELTPNAAGTSWTETVLYNFCSEKDCNDSDTPAAGVVRDSSGNLYGTTTEHGVFGQGAIFELSPDGNSLSYKILHNFCSLRGCVDGYPDLPLPNARLILDASGNLYGTTLSGGAYSFDGGTVFKLTPSLDKTKWSYAVIHSFCSLSNCADGQNPFAGVIKARSGYLFGTTNSGGTYGRGTVFQLTPPAVGNTQWKETVLHSFCSQANCLDGAEPWAGVIMDQAANLYGVTSFFGGEYDRGTAFQLER